jgi:hypothetical protein
MTLSTFSSQYAPALADLAEQLDALDPVLCGYGAGPQKPDDPDQRQRLYVCIDNPWREPDQWVTIYSTSHCEWWDEGEEWRLTFDDLLAYLRQLPRPLHSFSKFQP